MHNSQLLRYTRTRTHSHKNYINLYRLFLYVKILCVLLFCLFRFLHQRAWAYSPHQYCILSTVRIPRFTFSFRFASFRLSYILPLALALGLIIIKKCVLHSNIYVVQGHCTHTHHHNNLVKWIIICMHVYKHFDTNLWFTVSSFFLIFFSLLYLSPQYVMGCWKVNFFSTLIFHLYFFFFSNVI